MKAGFAAFAVLTAPLAVMAESIEHNRAGIGWTYTQLETVDGTKINSFGLGAGGEIQLSGDFYAGGQFVRSSVTYDLPDTAEYIDGNINEVQGHLGAEKAASDTVSGFLEIAYNSATADLTRHRTLAADQDYNVSTDGFILRLGMAKRLQSARLEGSVSKGVSGDYEDSDPGFHGTLHFDSPQVEGFFSELSVSFIEDGYSLGGQFGLHF